MYDIRFSLWQSFGKHDQRRQVGAIADLEFFDRECENGEGRKGNSSRESPLPFPLPLEQSRFSCSLAVPKYTLEIPTDIRRGEKYLRKIFPDEESERNVKKVYFNFLRTLSLIKLSPGAFLKRRIKFLSRISREKSIRNLLMLYLICDQKNKNERTLYIIVYYYILIFRLNETCYSLSAKSFVAIYRSDETHASHACIRMYARITRSQGSCND